MGRRVFISYQHNDREQARGFALLQWNRSVDFTFVGRHLLTPVNSENESYIKRRVREEMDGTSVTVVLIGQNTKDSKWVRTEVEDSIARGNGVIGIKLKNQEDAPIPDYLRSKDIEVINWNPSEFSDAVERCALVAGRKPQGPPSYSKSVIGRCAR